MPSFAMPHTPMLLLLVGASFAARSYLYPAEAASHMRMGESQYNARLAVRVLEDGPFAYSGWVDKLSMYPSANRPSDFQPPGAHFLAAAGLLVERLFSHSDRSLFHIAPAAHCVLMLLMYARAAFLLAFCVTIMPLMYAMTRSLSRSPTPALVAAALCAVIPALQKHSFPGLLTPAVFEPVAAAAVSVAYLRLMAMPTARNVALVVLAAIATAVTCETFLSVVCLISISFAREVFSHRVDKCGHQQRLAQVTCVVDVLAVTGVARPPQLSQRKSHVHLPGVVVFALFWFGLPLALPPQPSLLYLPPVISLILVFCFGRKAVDFFYTHRDVVKPVVSLRALLVMLLLFVVLCGVVFARSSRLQPPAFPPTNVIRCNVCPAFFCFCQQLAENTEPLPWGSALSAPW
jgi:hypothetical protein